MFLEPLEVRYFLEKPAAMEFSLQDAKQRVLGRFPFFYHDSVAT
jgi:hypothetical protein